MPKMLVINMASIGKWRRKEISCNLEENTPVLTKVEAKRMVRKLCRHHKYIVPAMKFSSRSNNHQTARIRIDGSKVWFPSMPNAEVICHELAHINLRGNHTEEWFTNLIEMLRYSKNHNYWRL
jgi:hypothetical protein